MVFNERSSGARRTCWRHLVPELARLDRRGPGHRRARGRGRPGPARADERRPRRGRGRPGAARGRCRRSLARPAEPVGARRPTTTRAGGCAWRSGSRPSSTRRASGSRASTSSGATKNATAGPGQRHRPARPLRGRRPSSGASSTLWLDGWSLLPGGDQLPAHRLPAATACSTCTIVTRRRHRAPDELRREDRRGHRRGAAPGARPAGGLGRHHQERHPAALARQGLLDVRRLRIHVGLAILREALGQNALHVSEPACRLRMGA